MKGVSKGLGGALGRGAKKEKQSRKYSNVCELIDRKLVNLQGAGVTETEIKR